MKKLFLLASIASLVISCGTSKKSTGNNGQDVFDQPTRQLPCTQKDNPYDLVATGTAYGYPKDLDILKIKALDNAKAQVYRKLCHHVSSVISSYMAYGEQNDAEYVTSKCETVTSQTIDQFINEIGTTCEEISVMDNDGKVYVYLGIKIPKQAFAVRCTENIIKSLYESKKIELNISIEELQTEVVNRL